MIQVLITRTHEQAQPLMDACSQLSMKPVVIPCVQIRPDIRNNHFLKALADFSLTDIIIIVSANAAQQAIIHWPSTPHMPPILSVGPATAKAIEQCGMAVAAIANPPDTSGLLNLPLLQNVKNKRITIFCGRQPKKSLEEALLARGAQVQMAYCYERNCPVPMTVQSWSNELDMNQAFITISTSHNLLENLIFITPNKFLTQLFSAPLVVISKDMVTHAKVLGFTDIYQAKNATLEAIRLVIEKIVNEWFFAPE